MDDSGPEVPGFVRVDENCSYGVSRTKWRAKNVWSPIYEIKWGTCSEFMASFLKNWSQMVDFLQHTELCFSFFTNNTHWPAELTTLHTAKRIFKQTFTKISPKWVIIAIRVTTAWVIITIINNPVLEHSSQQQLSQSREYWHKIVITAHWLYLG